MGLKLNKIFAAILIGSIFCICISYMADYFFKPAKLETRGFKIEVTEVEDKNTNSNAPEEAVDIKLIMAKANASAGSEIAKKCVSCHSFDKGGANKIGPNLYDVYAEKKASKRDYKYSSAMSEKGGEWNDQDLYAFLHKPKEFVPGTKMVFPGMQKPEDIANMIAYLKSLKG